MIMLSMILMGGIVLAILCHKDYRRNVFKPKSNGKYYIAFFLFTLMNMSVYLTLCAVLLHLPLTDLNLTLMDATFENIHYLVPFAIAITYFGVGAGSFKVGTVEIRLYNKLLDLFQNLFPMTDIKIEPPPQSEDGKIRYETLRNKITQLQVEADASKGWEKMDGEWSRIKEDTDSLIQQIEEFSHINESLSVSPMTEKNLEKITLDIKDKIGNMWNGVNLMLSRFVINLVFSNIKDRSRIEAELESIGWYTPCEVPVPSNPRSRIIGVGLLVGLVFGLVSALAVAKGAPVRNPIINMWCGALSFTVFALFYAQFHRITNVGKAIINGLLGGLCGHLSWIVMSKIQTITQNPESLPTMLNHIISDIPVMSLNIGALYGAVSAALLFACRRSINFKLPVRYIMVSLCGGVAFVVLHLSLGISLGRDVTVMTAFKSLIQGVIALLGLSYATNIFHGPEYRKNQNIA